MSQFFTSGGQRIGVSFSASVLPMNIQDWFPSGFSGLISLQSKGLSKSSPAPQFKSIKDDKHYFQKWTAFWMATWPISLEFSLLSSQVPCVVCVSRSVVSHSCNPMDCSPPGSSVHGILQTRILKWVAIPFSKGSSLPRDRTLVSCIVYRFFTVWATMESSQTVIFLIKNIQLQDEKKKKIPCCTFLRIQVFPSRSHKQTLWVRFTKTYNKGKALNSVWTVFNSFSPCFQDERRSSCH